MPAFRSSLLPHQPPAHGGIVHWGEGHLRQEKSTSECWYSDPS